jgi:hypothetical protein
MRNLLALVGLIVVGFAGLGWYFNWYSLQVKTGTDGKVNVSGDVDLKKIKTDAGAFTDKVGQALRNANQPPEHPDGLMGPPMPKSSAEGTTPVTAPSQPDGRLGDIKLPLPGRS